MSSDPKLEANVKAALEAVVRARKLVGWLERMRIGKVIRILLEKLEGYPTLETDLEVIEQRLRGMLSSDPDRTPRVGLSSQNLQAAKPPQSKG